MQVQGTVVSGGHQKRHTVPTSIIIQGSMGHLPTGGIKPELEPSEEEAIDQISLRIFQELISNRVRAR